MPPEQYETTRAQGGCVDPTVFAMTNGGYDPFTSYASSLADEECDQSGATNDVVLPVAGLTPWCSLPQSAN